MGANNSLAFTWLVGLSALVASCSPYASPQPRPNKLFIGCAAPIHAPGSRSVVQFLHYEDRAGRLAGLYFEVADPNVAPDRIGSPFNRFTARPISDAGADLVRRNVKEPGRPSNYRGMSDSDQMAMHLVVFGTRAVHFDKEADFGRLSEETILPTDDLVFLEPGWAIGMIVSKEKVGLAPAYKASASAALTALLARQKGCAPSQGGLHGDHGSS